MGTMADERHGVAGMAKALRLPAFGEYENHVDPSKGFDENLAALMSLEVERRDEASFKRRIKEAGFPVGKTLDTFEFPPSLPNLKKEQLYSLATCKFIDEKTNVCAIGGSGTGKTHAMAAIGREAVRLGYSVKFMRVSDMITMLDEAKSEKRLGVLMKTFQKYSML